MKNLILSLITIISLLTLLLFSNNIFSESSICYRTGKEKIINQVHYCPHENGVGTCFYKINCSDVGNGGDLQ